MLADVFGTLERTSPSRAPELMDRPGCDPDRLRRALDGLARVHRAFGGHRLIARPVLRSVAGRRPGPLRILDVGTGGGELAAGLGRRLRRRGWRPRFTLGDLHPRTIRIARERWSDRLRGRGPAPDAGGPSRPAHGEDGRGPPADFLRLDAPLLPFPDGAFDLAISGLTLHHLEDGEARAFLAELDRVTGGRWLVTDLRRSHLALAAVRLLAVTVWRRNPFPRRDGPVSVRRAFTPDEVRSLLSAAGVDGARVDGRRPVRLRIMGRGLAGG